MASPITLSRLLLRLPKSTAVPGASCCRYYRTVGSSSGYRIDTDCIAEIPGPVDHFIGNPLRTALYYTMDTIYPYTSTKNLRWSLNFFNDVKSQALPKSLLAHIKYSFIRGRWDVSETAETLRIFRDMRGIEQDVKVWVEEGTELMEPGKVWVENGNYVSDEGRKVFGQVLEWDVDGGVQLRNVFLNPSVTPLMKPEDLKRSELYTVVNNILLGNKKYRYAHHNITYPEMPYPSVSLFIKHDRQKGYEGKDFLPYTMRIGLPGNVYKTNDIMIEVKNELLKVIVPKMTVKRVSNLKCILESDPV